MVIVSGGSVNASVDVTSGETPQIDATSSSVTTVIEPSKFPLPPAPGRSSDSHKKRSSKAASGSGTGYGSGNGNGASSPPPPARVASLNNASLVLPPAPSPPPVRPANETRTDKELKQKLQAWLYAVVDRLRKGVSYPTTNENLFVHDGKADIQIELSVKSPEVLARLKASGFELVSEKGKTMVIGRITLDKLAALADIDEVKLVLPKI
jgi:hypothetical protein